MVGYSSGGRWDAGSRLLERLRFRSSRRPRSEYFSSALNSSSSAAAFIDQKDFTYYTPNQLSTLRCHSFELGDGCLLRRTRLQQQSSGSGQKSPTSPVNDIVCDVCHQQISTSLTTSAYYTCQVCGYVSHDRCLSQADNTCPTCLTRQPSTFFKTLSSSHLIPSSPEAVHAISLQPVSAVKSLVDMPSEVTMLTSSYQQQSMSARPNVKLHNRRWSSSTTAMPSSDDDRLTLMELGLTYITERIIALTCPLECPEPVYRSGLRDLFKMLQTKHANNFMIVNLSERIEEMHSISQKVLDFGWPDMLAPPLNRLCSICKSVESWLNVSSQNVVVFHCKTGLSRLAVVVSALIDYIKLCPDAAITTNAASTGDGKIQSLDYYAMKRFYETKLHSSTMPSQRRYIHYLSGLLTGSIRLNNNPVYLQRIAVLGLRDVDGRTQWNMSSSSSHCQLFVKIYQNLQPIFTSANTHLSIGDSSSTVIVLDTPVQLRCDVLVKCYEIASVAPGRTTTSNMLLQQERQLMFGCQFHVSAVTPDSTVVFTRKDLDEIGQSYLFTDSVRFEMELSSTPQPTSYNYSSGGSSGLVNSSTTVNAAGIGGQRNVLERCNSYEQFTELLRGNNFFDTVASFQPISVVSVDDGTAALPHHDQVLRRQKQQRLEQQPVGNASGHVRNSLGDVVANQSALFSKADGNLHTTTFHQQQQQLRVERVLKGEESEQFVSRLTPTGGAARLVHNGKMTESVPERISPASKTTEELEVQHNELDSVLRNLLTQEIKSVSPSTVHQRGSVMSAETFDTQTVTTHRTRELTPAANYHQQQQVVVAAETIERPTYHRKVTSSQSFDCGIATAAEKKLVTGGEDRAASGGGGVTDDDNCYRSYLSDSEDQLAWLQEQRNRLQQHVRKSAAWRSKTKQEKQLVSELRSAQNALATLRSRAQSESDSLDWQTGGQRTPVDSRYSTEYSGADDYSRYSRRTSLSSSRQDRCDVQPDPHYESGPDRERPVPVTTLQTTYTFAVGPHHRTASLDHGLSSSNYSTLNRSLSPRVPDRTASSHDVLVKSDQTVSETVEKTLVKNQLVEQMNKLSMTSLEAKTKPFEVIEEEVISLVPIGRGVQNIEPDATQPNGLFVRSGRMASSLSVPSSLSLVRGVSPSATSAAAAAVALGSQSTLTYQQVQMRPFGTTTATSNNLLGSNQTLRQSRSFTGDQQLHVIGQQEFERQMLLQQQQLDGQQELKRRNDIQRQEELRRSEELQRQQELLRQEEMKRLEELQRLEETRRQQEMLRQEELRRSEELQRQQELLRQEEMKRLEELQRLEETRKQQEMLRQEELRRSEELQRQQELLRQEEMKRLEELQRLEETRKQQEMLRQEELRRSEELQRQQELLRQEEMRRLEETRRQQEMLRQEELRRSEELRRQEELQRQQELIRQEQLKRHQLLEFENQIQQQHFQVQQQAMIREEQVSKQVGVTSSVPPLPTQSNSSNNCYQTITAVSSVSYQTTNRHLAETGHNLPVDVEMVQNLLSVPEQASAGNLAIRTVSASSADVCEFSSTTPRFVYDTSKIWHRPNVSRDEAINFLKDKPAGSFVIRNSSTFHGSFGLAVKVSQLPANVQPKGGDLKSALVRHFLIETTSKGVRLKGCSNEPTFGSLAALVYQHSITPLALPCKLLLPELNDLKDIDVSPVGSTSRQLVQQEAACNVIYVNSTDVESLTGAVAISKAIEHTFLPGQNPPNTTVVRFKVSAQGITLTDNQRKLFFRRHYPLTSVTYCGLDRQDNRLFGFVARKQNSVTENACHLLAEMDSSQPASAIVNFVERMLSEHGHVLG